jgi:hypothetical protein
MYIYDPRCSSLAHHTVRRCGSGRMEVPRIAESELPESLLEAWRVAASACHDHNNGGKRFSITALRRTGGFGLRTVSGPCIASGRAWFVLVVSLLGSGAVCLVPTVESWHKPRDSSRAAATKQTRFAPGIYVVVSRAGQFYVRAGFSSRSAVAVRLSLCTLCIGSDARHDPAHIRTLF